MVGEGGEVPLHSFYTHTYLRTLLSTCYCPGHRAKGCPGAERGGEEERGKKTMNQVCSLHTESCVALKRGVGLEGRVPGERAGWPRGFSKATAAGTGEGLERSTSEEEGGQGCCQETPGG